MDSEVAMSRVTDNAVTHFAMTLREAQEWDVEVGRAGNYLRLLLQDGYRREAWRVLGYSNWTACLSALADKHGFTERRLWQLHQANEIQARLTEPGSVDVIPERHLRPLTPLEPTEQIAAYQKAVETAPNGKMTAAHLEDVVRQFRQLETVETDPVPTNTRATMHSSESNEWYTPAEYIAAVRLVMGDIDLDPASCKKANNIIKARQYFTVDDDGLTREWHGRVFLNPPYGKTNGDSNQATWSDALIFHYKSGNVTEAILLVNATPGNKWFAPLWDYPICFVDHRIRFYNPDGEASQPTHSNCFVYLGPNRDKFAQVFNQYGVVAVRYEP